MVSLKFPFSFSKPPNNPSTNASFRSFAAASSAAFALGAGIAAGIAISKDPKTNHPITFQNALNSFLANRLSPMWGSLSLADSSAAPVTESRTGMSFPAILKDSQRLLGVGVRRKAVLGLKNIDVYAFGVYADDGDVKKCLSEKYGALSLSELKGTEEFKDDLFESDISMTVRLQIVYGRLSIRSVRSAFEDSVGSRLQKFGGSVNKELLQRFTSQFTDEYKIPKGTIIDLTTEQGHILRTTIGGKEVGCIQSKLLCRSVLDLYIGDEPFDPKAKEDFEQNLVSLLQK